MAAYIHSPTPLFFIHIPKTAGNSIRNHMIQIGGGNWTGNKHLTQKELFENTKGMRHFREGLEKYTFFTVVRNPYDRLVSAYHYYLGGGGRKEVILQRRLHGIRNISRSNVGLPETFEGFIRGDWIHPEKWGCATKLQSEYFDNAEIIRFENLEKDYFDFLLPRLPSMPRVRPLECSNKSEHKSWQQYYTPELAEIVYKMQKADFDSFGYSPDIGAG